MRSLLPLLAIGWAAMPASAQTCGPTFKEVHDFEVGDVFQVKFAKGHSGKGSRGNGTDTLWKYSITSKGARGDTLLYARNVTKIWSEWSGGDFPYPKTTTHLGILDYQDTVTYFSPAEAGFDGCEEDMASMPGFLIDDSVTTGFKTRIRLATAPLAEYPPMETGTRCKVFGADFNAGNNLYLADGQTPVKNRLLAGYFYDGKSTFAEGLGMVHAISYRTGGNSGDTWEWSLMGHVRRGDTLGTVEPDDVFRARQVGIRPFGSPAGKGRDGGRLFRSGVPVFRPAGSPWSFDLSGRRLQPD